jgi:hypothetical protein
MAWWKKSSDGHGHFDKKLYEKFLQVRYGIETNYRNQKN